MFTFGKTCVAVSVFHAQSMKKFQQTYLLTAVVYLHDGNLGFVYSCSFLVFCFASKRTWEKKAGKIEKKNRVS